MRILDKYILKEFLGPFLFGVAAFTAIFLGADTLLKIADYVTKYGASSTAALKIFILALPRIIVYTFPMAVLLGALNGDISAIRFQRVDCYADIRTEL